MLRASINISMRPQIKLNRGFHDAYFQGLVKCPDGNHRFKFLVLDHELEMTECIATCKKYNHLEVRNFLGNDPGMMTNTKWRVNVGKNFHGEKLTVTYIEQRDFITPKWFIVLQESWQGSKNNEAASERKELYLKNRLEKDKRYKLITKIRELQNAGIRGEVPLGDYERLFGIDYKGLINYIESQFKDKWNWLNRGSVWHLDHIKPLTSFMFKTKQDILDAMHYTNLQPLAAKDNLDKYNHYLDDKKYAEET